MHDKTFDDRSVKRGLSPQDRERLAESWLDQSGQLHGGPVNILDVLRAGKIELCQWSVHTLAGDKARAMPQVRTIAVCPGLFGAVRNGCREASMDIAHELGHCVINDGAGPRPLKFGGNAKLAWIPEGESEEVLAWQFGRAVMMPHQYIRDTDSAAAVADRFSVPVDQALKRLAELRLERRKQLQKLAEAQRRILPESAERCWRLAAINQEHDPKLYRLSKGGRLVAHAGFNESRHPLSWTIYNGNIYAKDELDWSWF